MGDQHRSRGSAAYKAALDKSTSRSPIPAMRDQEKAKIHNHRALSYGQAWRTRTSVKRAGEKRFARKYLPDLARSWSLDSFVLVGVLRVILEGLLGSANRARWPSDQRDASGWARHSSSDAKALATHI